MSIHEFEPRWSDTVPSAYVAKGRQRIKQYNNDTVYLNNGDEFEIELFNPTTHKYLAKIELNGNSVGSGVVLRPGERVFLERYLDSPRKFLFETYTVEGDNPITRKAIADNGNLRVKFFKEDTPVMPWPPFVTYTTQGTWCPPTDYRYYNMTGSTCFDNTRQVKGTRARSMGKCDGIDDTLGFAHGADASASASMFISNTSNTIDFAPDMEMSRGIVDRPRSKSLKSSMAPKMASLREESIETGRVEKGSHSNQNLVLDSSSFQAYHSYQTTWKILPLSQKPLVKEDLKVFCVSCGRKKRKQSEQYCSQCGTKY